MDKELIERIIIAVKKYVIEGDGTIEIRAVRDGIRISEIKRKSVGR